MGLIGKIRDAAMRDLDGDAELDLDEQYAESQKSSRVRRNENSERRSKRRVVRHEDDDYQEYIDEDDGSVVIREGYGYDGDEDEFDDFSAPKKSHKFRATLILTLIAIIALVVCEIAFCRVKVIKVNGVTQYDTNEVIASTGVTEGQNLLLVNAKSIEENLYSLYPYVEKIKLRRIFPTTAEISITEATVRYSIAYNGGYVYISQYGKLLDNRTEQETNSILLVGGEITDNDGYLKFNDEYQQQAYEEINTCLNERGDEISKITRIDISDVYNIKLLYDGRVLMNIGGISDLRYKLNFGLQIVMGSGISDTEYGTLDLTLSKENNRAYFNPTSQSEVENGTASSSETEWTLTFDGAGRIVDGVDAVDSENTASSESSSGDGLVTDTTDDTTVSDTDGYDDYTSSEESGTEETTINSRGDDIPDF